ncbi:hypothetical protein F5X98DRAFT_359596 [Xylaria grammica]|nr:hypothetical protein F5X98DRAFT_359596 [Xylaria grammica]
MASLNLPQPDFHVLSGHLQGMAVQVDRCSNLVAVQNTTTVLAAVARLADSVDGLTASVSRLSDEMRTMRTDMRTMRTDMQTMRTDMRTMRTDMETMGTDLRREMQTMGTGLRREMQTMRTDLRREMETMRTDLRGEMETMRTELREEMQTMRTELREEMQAMGDSLELRMDDIDYNNRARAFNSKTVATRPDSVIRPLRNITTHQVVSVPATIQELDALLTDDVKKCLEAFDQVPLVSAVEKKAQLKEYLGLY